MLVTWTPFYFELDWYSKWWCIEIKIFKTPAAWIIIIQLVPSCTRWPCLHLRPRYQQVVRWRLGSLLHLLWLLDVFHHPSHSLIQGKPPQDAKRERDQYGDRGFRCRSIEEVSDWKFQIYFLVFFTFMVQINAISLLNVIILVLVLVLMRQWLEAALFYNAFPDNYDVKLNFRGVN